MDNNGADSIVVGGYTQSKSLVWTTPSDIVPGKLVSTTLNQPIGCYSSTSYLCNSLEIGNEEKGVAYIFKAEASPNDVNEYIIWRRFFENYNQVTALKLSRSDTNNDQTSWNSGSSTWDPAPTPTTIYSNFVAAFLRSKCTSEISHKLLILDYSNGEIKMVIPYLSKQEVF